MRSIQWRVFDYLTTEQWLFGVSAVDLQQLKYQIGLGGGFTSSVTAYSYATAQTLLPHILGTNEVLLGRTTDWQAIARHAKLMICLGGLAAKNGLVNSGGAGKHDYGVLMRDARAAGVRFVNISPFRGDTEAELEAEWVPIRPGTDAALAMAMGHVILTEWHARGRGAYFLDYCRRFTDQPMLVLLEEKDGRLVTGQQLRAGDLAGELGEANNPDWKTVAVDDATGRLGQSGRLVVRASGTEPVIRVMGEGDDKLLVEQAVDDVIQALTRVAA